MPTRRRLITGGLAALGGLTLAADPAFHEGFDIAATNQAASAPLEAVCATPLFAGFT